MSFQQEVIFADLGIMGYKQAWDLQEQLLQQNVNAKIRARNLQMAPTVETNSLSDPIPPQNIFSYS